MSGRKNQLKPFHILKDVSMGANITSAVVGIPYLDNIAVQLNFTGTPTGTFEIQVSLDYDQDNQQNILNAGTWVPMTLSPSPIANGSSDKIVIELNQLGSPWLRIVYNRTSGSGTLNAYITAKMI